jgi:hypothetical protein
VLVSYENRARPPVTQATRGFESLPQFRFQRCTAEESGQKGRPTGEEWPGELTYGEPALRQGAGASEAIDRQKNLERLYAFSRAMLLTDQSAPFAKVKKLAELLGLGATVLYMNALLRALLDRDLGTRRF